MNDESLLFGVAAVLAGLATVQFVLGFVYTPALFGVALPFAAAAYLLWYQASGRLRERVEQGRAGDYQYAEVGSETGGFGAGPRESFSAEQDGFETEREGRFGGRAGGGGRVGGRGGRAGGSGARGGRGVRQDTGPSPRDAYSVLGLDPDADSEAVRRAYRERVKTVHPDREGGDEEEFKRVTEAYEVLRDRN